MRPRSRWEGGAGRNTRPPRPAHQAEQRALRYRLRTHTTELSRRLAKALFKSSRSPRGALRAHPRREAVARGRKHMVSAPNLQARALGQRRRRVSPGFPGHRKAVSHDQRPSRPCSRARRQHRRPKGPGRWRGAPRPCMMARPKNRNAGRPRLHPPQRDHGAPTKNAIRISTAAPRAASSGRGPWPGERNGSTPRPFMWPCGQARVLAGRGVWRGAPHLGRGARRRCRPAEQEKLARPAGAHRSRLAQRLRRRVGHLVSSPIPRPVRHSPSTASAMVRRLVSRSPAGGTADTLASRV